jgi:hypothetical protein
MCGELRTEDGSRLACRMEKTSHRCVTMGGRMQMGQMRRPERITSGTAQDKENARQMSYFGGVVKKTRVTNMEGGLESFVKI